MFNNQHDLLCFLEEKVKLYNRPQFIEADPISIPHRFSAAADQEISGLFAAILAWGNRKTIISKCLELMDRMDNSPHQFVLNAQDSDLKKLIGFKHRTFNDTDLLYFVDFLRMHYQQSPTLETAFLPVGKVFDAEKSLNNFKNYFFSLTDFPVRTRKHISSPAQKSACKRLNMFLRWMVRQDACGVDFGLWKTISQKDLICPCDVHVIRVAKHLGLIHRAQNEWKTAIELTEMLKTFDNQDPVKYDFALFSLGVEKII